MMVFDTLFGMDNSYQIQPQMVDRVAVEDDGNPSLTSYRRVILTIKPESAAAVSR